MCTSPRPVTLIDGKIKFVKESTLCDVNTGLIPFKVPCGKCAECLLERARTWGIRCYHETKIHAQNAFITLTYAPEHLPPDGKLRYLDFQLFMKRLRYHFKQPGIGFFMCGEYGTKGGRPHYHACLFGIDFDDKEQVRENRHGDKIWNSKKLTELWGLGHTELGTVTQKSAAYVARYVLKKSDPHEKAFQKMSTRPAIGARFVEKFWSDIFVNASGSVIIDGSPTKVPRYYEKWFKKNQQEKWTDYVTQTKPVNSKRLEEKQTREHEIYLNELSKRKPGKQYDNYKSPLARKREILKHKAKQLKRSYDDEPR